MASTTFTWLVLGLIAVPCAVFTLWQMQPKRKARQHPADHLLDRSDPGFFGVA